MSHSGSGLRGKEVKQIYIRVLPATFSFVLTCEMTTYNKGENSRCERCSCPLC